MLELIAEDVQAWRDEVSRTAADSCSCAAASVDRCSREEAQLTWFGLGTHFGRAVSQSVIGDLLGHVVNVGGDEITPQRLPQRPRAAHAHRPLRHRRHVLHAPCEVRRRIRVRPARWRCTTWIREPNLELLESIWNGLHLHRFGEQPLDEPPYTPIRIPVFSEHDGGDHGDPDRGLRVDGGRRVRCRRSAIATSRRWPPSSASPPTPSSG